VNICFVLLAPAEFEPAICWFPGNKAMAHSFLSLVWVDVALNYPEVEGITILILLALGVLLRSGHLEITFLGRVRKSTPYWP